MAGTQNFRKLSVGLIGILFVLAGVNHFISPNFYVRIMPQYLPAHLALVYVSGFFEVLGGIGVLIPKLRRAAGWGLIALLIAVFPANIHMLIHAEQFPDISDWMLIARLPLQFVLIAWIYFSVSRPRNGTRQDFRTAQLDAGIARNS